MALSNGATRITSPFIRRGRMRSALVGRTALAGALAFLSAAVPQAAWADGECGVPAVDGSLICNPSPDNYLNGIEYISDTVDPIDLSVVLAAGSVIAADGHTGMNIVNLNGSVDIRTFGAQVSTTGNYAAGLFGVSYAGNAGIFGDDVSTAGDHSDGVIGVATDNVTVSVGNVSTQGNDSYGIATLAKYGMTTVVAKSVETSGIGSVGIGASSDFGSIQITVGSVETHGDGAIGISTYNNAPSAFTQVSVDSLTTHGDDAAGIYAIAVGSNSVSAGTITTSGNRSSGIDSITVYGSTTIHAGSIQTSGDISRGIFAVNYYGNVNIGADQITTSGYNAFGIFSRADHGDSAVDAGTVSTSGDFANGVIAYSKHGHTTAQIGTIETTGTGSGGVFVAGGTGVDLTVGQVKTSGDYGFGVSIVAGNSSYGTPTTTGAVTAKIGSVETSGYAAFGVDAVALGDINLNIGQITTSGDASTGVHTYSIAIPGRHVQTLNIGQVVTQGDDSWGIDAQQSGGSLSLHAGSVATTGDRSTGLASSSFLTDVSIDLADGVSTMGAVSDGVWVQAESGSLQFVNHGTITTAGYYSRGIIATTQDSVVSIDAGDIGTSGDLSSGVVVHSSRGSAEVTAGTIVTSGRASHGIDVSTTDRITGFGLPGHASSAVTAGSEPVQDISVHAGTVQVSGADAIGIRAVGYGAITVDATNTFSKQASAIQIDARNGASLTLHGQTAGGGAQAVTVAGADVSVTIDKGGSIVGTGDALVVDARGPYVPPVHNGGGGGIGFFAATASSSGAIFVANAGVIAGGTGYAVLVNGGAASLNNSGTIQGAVKLADGDDVLTNSGTFVATKDSDFGAGNDTFVNTGKLVVQPGTKPGNITLLGLESFQNAGLIDLRNGVTGDTLTLPGNYIASGKAALGVDLGTNGVADKFIINGTVTGTTSILINETAGTATLLSTPITLIQAGGSVPAGVGNTGMAANAFSIANQSVGFVTYGLSFNAATNSFQLTAQAGSPVYRLAKLNEAAQAIGQQSGAAWRSHMAELRDLDEPARRVWGQAYGQVDSRHEDRTVAVQGAPAQSYDLGYRQDYFGAQAGVDLAGKRAENGNGLLFGVTGGYLSSHMNFRAGADRVRFDTVNAGGYAGFKAGPLFANLLGQYVHYRTTAFNGVEQWSDKFSGNGYGVQGEVGARLGSDTLFAEPVASLAWQHTDLGTLQALGQSLGFDKESGLTGSFGARLGGSVAMAGGGKAVFYAKASYVHAFSGKGGVLFTSGGTSEDIAGTKLGNYGQGAIGVNVITAGRVSGFIEGDADVGGSTHGGGGRVGFRFKL